MPAPTTIACCPSNFGMTSTHPGKWRCTELVPSFLGSCVGRLGPEGTTAWTKVPWFVKISPSETLHVDLHKRWADGDLDVRLHSCSLLKPRFAGRGTRQSN